MPVSGIDEKVESAQRIPTSASVAWYASGDQRIREVAMNNRASKALLVKAAAVAALLCALTGGAAEAAPPVNETTPAKTAAQSQVNSWVPIAAYATYWECANAASAYPGFATCTYVG